MTGPQLAWTAAVVVLASTVQGALGFGATLIVVSLGALRVPIAELLPVLVPISCLATATIFIADRAHVEWRLLLRRILPLMSPGVLLGALLADALADDAARRVYGVLVVLLAAHALAALGRAASSPASPAVAAPDAELPEAAAAPASPATSRGSSPPMPAASHGWATAAPASPATSHGWATAAPASPATSRGSAPPMPAASHGWVALAGLMHGVFATGGPLLVFAVDRLGLSPRAFRATLAGVWLSLNLLLTAGFAARGRLDAGTAVCSAALVPALAAGLALGHRVHTGLDRRTLRAGVLGLLLVAGVILVTGS